RTALQLAQKNQADLVSALGRFQDAQKANDVNAAQLAYNDALGLSPGNPDVQRAGLDLQRMRDMASTTPAPAPAQLEGQAVFVRIKNWPEVGSGMTKRETQRISVAGTVQSKEQTAAVLVIDRLAGKSPAKYLVKYDRATSNDGRNVLSQ